MKRGTVERQLSHLEEQVRTLSNNRDDEFIRFATEKETLRMLELLSKLGHIKKHLCAKYAPEETRELIELLVTFSKRRDEQAGGE